MVSDKKNNDNSYWCLFCGEDGPRWDTTKELFHHMETTVHRTKDGGMFIPTGNVIDES